MASLAETNPYLKDPEARQKMVAEDARASSVFEGARGLKPVPYEPVTVSSCFHAETKKV